MLFSYTLFTITPISTSLCCCKTLALNQLILFLLNPAGRSAKVPSFFPLLSSLLHPFVHKYKYRTVYFICKSVIVHVYSHIRVHVLSCRFWSSNWINYNVFLLVHLFCGMTHQNKERKRSRGLSPEINLDSCVLKPQRPSRHLGLLLVTEAHISTNYNQMVLSAPWQANSELQHYLKSKQVQDRCKTLLWLCF